MFDFYPRPPRGGRHLRRKLKHRQHKFLSTPSARRATLSAGARTDVEQISIHALREEGDPTNLAAFADREIFLSTPSARRATLLPRFLILIFGISIHALREEGDKWSQSSRAGTKKFLSTPSARRATPKVRQSIKEGEYFYPRPPRGGRLEIIGQLVGARRISIHALREEGDPSCGTRTGSSFYFYPRPPRGGRLSTVWPRWVSTIHFYPRPPRGGRQI